MKRFTIGVKHVGGFSVPVIKERVFLDPKRLGSWCADDGSLWTSLDNGENIFKELEDAEKKTD